MSIMDTNRRLCNKRVCLTYIITFSLLVLFFYHLMWNNRKSIVGLSRLQEDVNCITQALKVDCAGQKYSNLPCGKTNCLARDSQKSIGCNARELNACVDTLVKRKLGNIMDDVYSLKKQVMERGCKAKCNKPPVPNTEALILAPTRINYASEELGARIIYAIAKPISETSFIKNLLGLDFSANPPINMLRPSILPGSCFGFRGTEATVSLHLAKVIFVDEISLSHVAKEMTPSASVDNAPKDFEVYGLPPDSNKKELLGQWVYENDLKKRTQNYVVKNRRIFCTLVFVFRSNHGANSTCVYRVEVYGRVP
ncbi:SUN domain-containing protein 3 [Drosophila virilis]|uniref:SUN domain-containing protein n=1 Tax=Drosophila virilis TaxID=7244 RepID=B4LQT4_DROVI|nr:SUN domain-containing protein 3 [Drosophila virilis]EDW63468.2 uncharacterized protein Dvir_GJ12925 [Drosophila virilis]